MSLCPGMYQVDLSDNNFQQQIRDQNHDLLIATLILGIRLNVSVKFATWNLLKIGWGVSWSNVVKIESHKQALN